MRPDEHKKKKNAQYKKKHGMAEKENKTETKSKSSNHDKKEKPSTTKGDDSSAKDANHADKKLKNEVKVEVTEEDIRHYGRRKLVSNWSRYEDASDSEGDDDIPLQRGEDFNKLLAQAGGSATQFRLKDEEDWNDESQGSTTTAVLAVDFEKLSESLDCIPLHKKLGIDDHVFTEEQLNEMKAYSAEKEKQYRLATGEMSNISKTKSSRKSMDKSEKSGFDSSNAVRKSGSSAVENNDTKKTGKSDPVTCVKAKGKNDFIQNKLEQTQAIKDPAKEINKKEVEKLEDDLDMILSFGETGDKKESVNKVDSIVSNDTKIKTENVKSVEVECISKGKEKISNTKGNGNLEDWLDSMLDD